MTNAATGTNYHYLADGLGSITEIQDSAKATIETYTYDSFGNPTIKDSTGTTIPQSAISNPYMFTSREWDEETGLYYYRARYYDAGVGRFLSEDLIGFKGGINFYVYVDNNPIIYNDPLGLLIKKCRQLTNWQEIPRIGSNDPPPGAVYLRKKIKNYYKTIQVAMTKVSFPGVKGSGALACSCHQRWLYREIETWYEVKIKFEAMFLCWYEDCPNKGTWTEAQNKEGKREEKYTKREDLLGEFWEGGIVVGNTCSCNAQWATSKN